MIEAFQETGGGDEVNRYEFKEEARNSQQLILRCNFRCPAGVADLAINVAELLLERFPQCADRVEEMRIQHKSDVPVFIQLPGARPAACIMGEGDQRISYIDPCRAVFLVRTSEDRERLRTEGVRGTLLTVAEAKGLEFDVVVLCGFLSDSPDSTLWSLAQEDTPECLAADAARVASANSVLSPQEHRTMCRVILAIPELKSLYVAITRARSGCIFLEWKSDPSVWEPLLGRWQKTGLVDLWAGYSVYKHHIGLERGVSDEVVTTETVDDRTGVVRWLLAELSARSGRLHKKSRAILLDEFHRMQSEDAVVDASFRCSFIAAFGELVAPQTAEGDVRSFVPAMERRFKQEGVDVTPLKPEHLALHMLAHATDDVRERWRVFEEALDVLHHAKEQAGTFLAVSRESLVHQQLFTVLQEASRTRSCRGGSSLSRLRRLDAWHLVFSFLTDDEDLTNTVAFAAEVVSEQHTLHRELDVHIILTRAWSTFSRALFDPKWQTQEEKLKALIREGIPDCVARKRDVDASGHVTALCDVQLMRASQCLDAAPAFMATAKHRVAAEALEEASRFAGSVPELLRGNYRIHPTSTVGTQALHTCEAQVMKFAHMAADAWLLIARQAVCEGRVGRDALLCAAEQFARARKPCEAACCALRAGDARRALRHLAGHSGLGVQSLTMLSAALMWEQGSTLK